MGIDWHSIEKKWQHAWKESTIFEADPKLKIPKLLSAQLNDK